MHKTASGFGERVVLDLGAVGIAAVPVFGRYAYTTTHAGLLPHAHPHCIEICFLARGSQTYRVGGQDYHVVSGDIFVTFPNESHSTGSNPEDRGILYWMQLRIPPRGRSFLGLSAADTRLLLQGLQSLKYRHFTGRPHMKGMLDNIFRCYQRGPDTLRRVDISNHLVRYLLDVLRCAKQHSGAPHSPAIGALAKTIADHPENNYRLEDLAHQTWLSLPRFKVRFKQETGIPPREFILRQKIHAARDQLARSTTTVTQVALHLGFASSQYFATVFKRYTGQTPQQFRKIGPRVPMRRA
jgi:AraC-like DNA-binding protein